MFYRHSGSILFHLTRGGIATHRGVFFDLFEGVGDLIIKKKNCPKGFLLRVFRLLPRDNFSFDDSFTFLPSLIGRSSSKFSIFFDLVAFVFCIASGTKLSFECV